MSSQKDPNQIAQAEHDDDLNAKRVVIVGGSFDTSKMQEQAAVISKAYADMAAQMQDSIKQAHLNAPQIAPASASPTVVAVPEIVKETIVERVEVPVIVKETSVQTIRVPEIVKEVQIKEIQVPVIQTEIKLVEVPIITKEISEIAIPKVVTAALLIQSVISLGLMAYLLLK